MTELRDTGIEQIFQIPKSKRWEEQPDLIVSLAAKAVMEQGTKPQRIFRTEDPNIHDGIYLSPRWENCRILKAGQRRGIKDLFPRGASFHNVSFGIAEVRKPDGNTLVTHIAIKTFDIPTKAINDAAANYVVLERGFNTTDPICVVISNSKGYILSVAKEGVQALDTEPWHQFSPNFPEIESHFLYRLRQVSETLADLNIKGICHGDAKLRNYWATPENTVEPFDWESSRIFSDPPKPADLITIVRHDLMSLFRSLQVSKSGVAFLVGSPESKHQQFKTLVFQYYFERLLERVSDPGKEKLIDAIGEIEYFF